MDYSILYETMSSVVGEREDIRDAVRPEHFDGTTDYCVTFSWRLNNDPERPAKRSKDLVIVISQEAIEDFEKASDSSRGEAIEKLKAIVSQILDDFDPDHDTPIMEQVPSEKFVIKSRDLISG